MQSLRQTYPTQSVRKLRRRSHRRRRSGRENGARKHAAPVCDMPREMASCTKLIDLGLQTGAKDVYIVAVGATQMKFPPGKRTPLEAIENGCGLSLLTFTRVNKSVSGGLRNHV